MENVKKITNRSINALLPEKAKRNKAQAVCVIRGFAYDVESVTTDVGTHQRYVGSFELLNAKGEAVEQSTRIVFPAVCYDECEQAYADAKAGDGNETALVNFAVVIGIKPAQNAMGCTFTADILAAGRGDKSPLDQVREATDEAIKKALA